MTFLTLQKRAAKKLKLLDSGGNFLTGRDISQEDLKESINDAYLETAVPALAQQHPEFFEKISLSANYSVTGVVGAGSTGATLVATTAIFTLGMVGQYVYNSTDSESRKIIGYTNTTTVTLENDINDDWDGDTIKIINKIFTLEGDAVDAMHIKYVKVRYTATAGRLKASSGFENQLVQSNDEVYSGLNPQYYLTSVENDAGDKVSAFTILPQMTIADDYAIEVKYIEMPSELSDSADVPRLPLGHHEFLYWKAVMDGAVIRKENDLIAQAKTFFNEGLQRMISEYQPQTHDTAIRSHLPRRLSNIANRTI